MLGVNYSLEISANIKDLVGNRPNDATIVSFSTLIPEVVKVEPQVDAVDVAADEGPVSVKFSGPINLTALVDIQLLERVSQSHCVVSPSMTIRTTP